MKKITIHIPASGGIAKFEIDPGEYAVKMWPITDAAMDESPALRAMVQVTGATHHGRITRKGREGGIEELDAIIDAVDRGDGVAFYAIVGDEEQK